MGPHGAALAFGPNPASCFSRLKANSAHAWLWHTISTTKQSPKPPPMPQPTSRAHLASTWHPQ